MDKIDIVRKRDIELALDIIVKDGRASTSHIQRRLRYGYNRAATIIDDLESLGLIGKQIGCEKRVIHHDKIKDYQDSECD